MATILAKKPKPAAKPLPAVPRQPMTAPQQAEALRRAQAQADQRVKLGVGLFKAAEKQLATQSDMLRQVRDEQKHLRETVQQDVAKSLQSYDQWIGRIDEGFTTALRTLEAKVDAVSAQWLQSQERIEKMVRRSEALLAQSRAALDEEPTERTPLQPLKFRPTLTAGAEPTTEEPPRKAEADDEKLYGLILDKLHNEPSSRDAG